MEKIKKVYHFAAEEYARKYSELSKNKYQRQYDFIMGMIVGAFVALSVWFFNVI